MDEPDNEVNTVTVAQTETTQIRVYVRTRDTLKHMAARAVLSGKPEPTFADIIESAMDLLK